MSRETISATSMTLTRRYSEMKTVEKTKTSLTNTMTPHPHFFLSNLSWGSEERRKPTKRNKRRE